VDTLQMDGCLERIRGDVSPLSRAAPMFAGLALSSCYQPIYCAANQAIHGYEGLLVAIDDHGRPVPAKQIFEQAHGRSEGIYLDWLARALHLRGFSRLGEDRGRLYLNVTPDAAIEDSRVASVFVGMLAEYGVRPDDVVVEILETGVAEECRLAEAVRFYKALGFVVALDDFGVGVSEMERVWRLQPDIVKIDRAVIRAASRDAHAVRVLRSVVRMLHDCGARVVIEGIEDRRDALLALDTNADYLQGFHLARPSPVRADAAVGRAMLEGLTPPLDRIEHGEHAETLEATAMALETGAGFASAMELLLHPPTALRGYLVARDGRVLASSFHRGTVPGLADRGTIHGIGWNIRRLVRQAVAEPQRVLRTPPYVAFGTGQRCTTFGYGFRHNGEIAVLCTDITWP
jgi:EAL domain-containing protein (putative c-di-GMP-specific phosphodiesterase class I)